MTRFIKTINMIFQKPGGMEYGGIVTPEDLKRIKEEEEKRLAKAKRAKAERRCPTCDIKVN